MKTVDKLFLLLFSAFLIIGPFFRGLFFREDFTVWTSILSVLFIMMVVIYIKSGNMLVENVVDILVILYAAVYCITIFFGISSMDSVDGALKLAGVFMAYKIMYTLAKREQNRSILINTIIAVGFMVALGSMLGASGIVSLRSVFGMGDRLMGLYQYPNATAAVLGAAAMLNLFVIGNQRDKRLSSLYFTVLTTQLLAFLLTQSRGAMLAFVGIFILGILLVRNTMKLRIVAYLFTSLAISIALYGGVLNSFISHSNSLLYYIILLAAAVGGALLLQLIFKYIDKLKERTIGYGLIAVVGVVILTAIVALNYTVPLEINSLVPLRSYEFYNVQQSKQYTVELTGTKSGDSNVAVRIDSMDDAKKVTNLASGETDFGKDGKAAVTFSTLENTQYITISFINPENKAVARIDKCIVFDDDIDKQIESIKLKYRLLPDAIAKRINEINLKTVSSAERIIFMKDGLKAVKDHPLLGTGANSWEALYTKYRSYPYISKEVHSYYLQTAIETGVIGILILAALVGFTLYSAFIAYKNASEQGKPEIVGVSAFIFMVLGHSAIDFDMSLYAIALLVWGTAGLLAAYSSSGSLAINTKHDKIFRWTAVIIAAAIACLNISIFSGMYFGKTAVQALKSNDITKAKSYYEKAIRLDRFNMTYQMDYNQILANEYSKSGDNSGIDRLYTSFINIEKKEPYNSKYYDTLLKFYLKTGHLEDAQRIIERNIELNPLSPISYDAKANIYHDIMNKLAELGRTDESVAYARKITDIEAQYEKAMQNSIYKFELSKRTRSIITVAKDRVEKYENSK